MPFDPAQLMGMRVRPADFARLCGVSKQAVSQWVKRGTIALLPDGTLDPVQASRQVLENSDPSRLRARIFKNALQDPADLRASIRRLEGRLAELEKLRRADALRARDAEAARVSDLCRAIEDGFEALVRAEQVGELDDVLDLIVARVYGWPTGDLLLAHGSPAEADTATLSPAKVHGD